jgi:hypothetical protein
MRYVKGTLLYIKSNPLLIPCYLIAAFAFGLLINPAAYQTISLSLTDGNISNSFTAWLSFLTLFNPQNVYTSISSVMAYIILICDLAFIHSLVDKHIRFGTKSLRSVTSGFNINIVNGIIFAAFAIIAQLIVAAVISAVMKTCELIPVSYSYIAGIIICAAIFLFVLFVAGLFLLWLPCVEVTGFKKFDALNYSYALARPKAWNIFAAFAVPAAATFTACIAVGLLCARIVTYLVLPVIMGLFFVYTAVLSYIIYAEEEGISREDLKKY